MAKNKEKAGAGKTIVILLVVLLLLLIQSFSSRLYGEWI